MNENQAFLLAGVRTPFGRLNGRLSGHDALELGTLTLKELARRHPVVAEADSALLACVVQAGLGPSAGRTVMHRSGIGNEIPASTHTMACPAGIDIMVDATRRIRSGEGSLYIVGAFESASRGPDMIVNDGPPISALEHEGLTCRIGDESLLALSERKGGELGFSRDRQDDWAYRSQLLAAGADFVSSGEVFPIEHNGSVYTTDEGIRPNTTRERLAQLDPIISGGTITAGNASQIADGAAMGLVGTEEMALRAGLDPLARIVGWGYAAGHDNTLHDQPVSAVRKLLASTGLEVGDVDLWEINEAYASVVLHAIDELSIPSEVVNPNGGAIALGHPNSATAVRQVITLAHELRRRGLRRGIATLCAAGGQGIAVLIENDI